MTVASRSISECAASVRIASEPVAKPTIALAAVKPPEATIEPSATCSFSLAMSGSRAFDTQRARRRQCSLVLVAGVAALRKFKPALAAIGRFARALGGVNVAVDDLQIGQAPERQQGRPRRVAMLAPDPEQRDAVVDLGAPQQAALGLRAATDLQPLEHAHLIAGRIPELPRDDAGRVPCRVGVGSGLPQIAMPAKPEHRLTADAAEARAARELALAVGGGRRPERRGQAELGIAAEPPSPAGRCAGLGRERARQTLGANRVVTPIGIDRKPRHRWNEPARERVVEHGRRKHLRQRLVEARQRAAVLLVSPIRHDDPAFRRIMAAERKRFVSAAWESLPRTRSGAREATRCLWPSFETRRYATLLRMRPVFAATFACLATRSDLILRSPSEARASRRMGDRFHDLKQQEPTLRFPVEAGAGPPSVLFFLSPNEGSGAPGRR